MSKVTVKGNPLGTGTFTIEAPNSDTDSTLLLPVGSGSVVLTDATQTLTNKTIALANNTLTGVQETLVSGTNIKTINNTSLLGSGNITISGGGTATAVTTTTSSTNSNFKVPFANTTANTTGDYAYLQDSTTNFTYNPSTNTLNNLTLGTSVSVPSAIIPAASSSTRGGVYGDGSSTTSVAYGYGTSSSYYGTAVGLNSTLSNQGYQSLVGAYSSISSVASVSVGYGNNIGNYSYNQETFGSVGVGSHIDSSQTQVTTLLLGSGITATATSGAGVIALKGTTFTGTPWQIGSSGFYVDPVAAGTASDVLYYNTTTKQVTYGPGGGGGSISLEDLTDVNISNPQNGQTLTYSNGYWVNSGGGGGGGSAAVPILATGVNQYSYNTYGYTFSTLQDAQHVYDVLYAFNSNGYEIHFVVVNASTEYRTIIAPYMGVNLILNNTEVVIQWASFNQSFTGAPPYVAVEAYGISQIIPSQPEAIGTGYFNSSVDTALVSAFGTANLPYNAYMYTGNYDSTYWTTTQSYTQYPVTPPAINRTLYSPPLFIIESVSGGFSQLNYPFGSASQSLLYIQLGKIVPT